MKGGRKMENKNKENKWKELTILFICIALMLFIGLMIQSYNNSKDVYKINDAFDVSKETIDDLSEVTGGAFFICHIESDTCWYVSEFPGGK